MLPDWLDAAADENAALAKLRQLRGRGVSWGELIAGAQAIIGIHQEYSARRIERLYDEDKALDLVAAARIMDAASQSDEIDEAERLDLAMWALVAFGMYGNSLSSWAVAKRVLRTLHERTPAIAAVFGTAAPQTLGAVMEWCPEGTAARNYLEQLAVHLRSGDSDEGKALRAALEECIREGESSFERSLLLSCELCLEHFLKLNVADVLGRHWKGCPPQYINRLVDSGVVLLLPPQYKAIVEKGLLESADNALIALPTSAGKTLLGELCLLTALADRPGLVCYVAPYVALGRQVAESFRSHLPARCRIHALVGASRGEESLKPDARMEVVVATPERLDSLLRIRPELASQVRCLVCDEAHMIQNDTRGVRLEGLITRVRMLQENGMKCRIVLISAVLPEYAEIMAWLGIPDSGLITDSWRPTARRLAIWRQDGRLLWYQGNDPVRQSGVGNDHVVGMTDVPWPKKKFYGSKHYGGIRQQEPDVFENVAYLLELLHTRYGGGPILCYCSSRSSTRRLAAALAKRMPDLEPIPETVSSAIVLIRTRHKVLRPLGEMLRRGVAYHNAALPHGLRACIEEAVKERDILFVTATTTLAEGVDLPFRYTVLSDWLTWEGESQKPLPSLLFRNIAGRCGRAGVMTEGDTIIFDNPIGDPKYTDQYSRHTTLRKLFIDPPSGDLKGALSQASHGTEEFDECFGELASQFLAAIPENPGDEQLNDTFADHLYSTRDEASGPRIRKQLRLIEESILDARRHPLAVAASPLRLTDFGRAALPTSFSPESCRRIAEYLRGQEPGRKSHELAAHILQHLGTLPEQNHSKVRKILGGRKNSQLQVKAEDFPDLLKQWVQGKPLQDMFLSLPALARSKKKGAPKIGEWAAGMDEPTVWDDDFDKFCDVVEVVFVRFLPRLMRACLSLSHFVGGWAETRDWAKAADYVEAGVNSEWAVAVVKSGLASERRPVASVGRRIPGDWISPSDPMGLRGIRHDSAKREAFIAVIDECLRNAGGDQTETAWEIVELRDSLYQATGISDEE